METLVFAANFLYVAAYFTNDVLRLRCLTLTAALCLAAYFTLQAEPMLTLVSWNLFFAALDVMQIARVLRAGKKRRGQIGSDDPSGFASTLTSSKA
jgi:hypothetical protein